MENGKTYRIKADPGVDKNLHLDLTQNYDTFEILSLKLEEDKDYRLHSSDYGIVVGRVIANGGFGVPNAKVSIFISIDDDDRTDKVISELYPFASVQDRDKEGLRYNVLPDYEVDRCHQNVGSLPKKEYILDNDKILEVFEKYYKFTTRTNNSGDYMLSGIPVGKCEIHMDLDLSDCGMLSQRPRDFLYKGHSIEEFESPNQFKKSSELDYLSQIITQNDSIDVIPFWGNESINPNIGITRHDINIAYKFEPTCIFMGSLVGDNKSSGISKKCIPSDNMGNMDELIAGTGTIEMIRKTLTGAVEEFQVKGNEVIDSNGVWCYQIPMNLDYMTTDEYGNLVPTDNPEKGIPTRTRVRFRASMNESLESDDFYFRGKVLIPNNPQTKDELDYDFGTSTKDSSYRDLFWDNVYTVKSYIPRFQKGESIKNERFTGIKGCNMPGNSSPMPYNNLRIKMPFMFTVLCSLIKSYVTFLGVYNKLVYWAARVTSWFTNPKHLRSDMQDFTYGVLKGGFCPELDNWYFAPKRGNKGDVISRGKHSVNLLELTFEKVTDFDFDDPTSNASTNGPDQEFQCITRKTDYLLSCIEMNLAQEYKVINFDFYNDWINGVIYFPRWMRKVRKKTKIFFGTIPVREKVRGCMDDRKIFGKKRRYVQQCALSYAQDNSASEQGVYNRIVTNPGCTKKRGTKQVCHKSNGVASINIFDDNGGIVHNEETIAGQHVFYMRPCEFIGGKKKVNLFATDIVLLGSLKEENMYGLPMAFKYLPSTTYQMPTNLALTNVEENGFILTTDKKTLCFSQKGQLTENDIQAMKSDSSFKDISDAMRGSDGAPNYSGHDDTIPTTEAAGISWDFTGYGQGENDFNHLYYPGGHFLGISCWDSKTNIKSCVNLSRICEMGAEISSRQEFIGGADPGEDGVNEDNIKRYYIVPNGLISNDEIGENDFRSMFATLNGSRQLFDEYGGRAKRSFKYTDALGFSGDFKDIVSKDTTGYNAKVNVADDMYSTGTYFSETGDYDPHEKDRTFRRSLENTNIGYYKFRFGIDDAKESRDKFVLNFNRGLALPQYENSFYFYFGIKEGSTAIDILNRDFFSVCQWNEKPVPEIQSEVLYENIDECSMTADIIINIGNVEEPVFLNFYNNDIPDVNIAGEKGAGKRISLKGVEFGEYTLEIMDSSSKKKTFGVTIGLDRIETNSDSVPFKTIIDVNTGLGTVNQFNQVIEKPEIGTREEYGGYIEMDRTLSYFDEKINIEDLSRSEKYIIFVCDKDGYFSCSSDNEPYNFPEFLIWNSGKLHWKTSRIGDTGKNAIHLWDSFTTYNVYLGISCGRNGVYSYTKIYTSSLSSKDAFELFHGCDILPYNGCLRHLKPLWWEKLPYSTDDYFTERVNDDVEKKCWALRHFCVNREKRNQYGFDSHVYLKSFGSETPNMIFSGNPEKYDPETNDIVPMIVGKNIYDSEFPCYTTEEYKLFPGYDISSMSAGNSVGEISVAISGQTGTNLLTRPAYGAFGYSSEMMTIGDVISKKVSVIYNRGEMTIRATVPGSVNSVLTNREFAVGQRAFIKINGNDFVCPVIEKCDKNGEDFIIDMKDTSGFLEEVIKNQGLDKLSLSLYPFYYFPVINKNFRIKANILSNSRFYYTEKNGPISDRYPYIGHKDVFDGIVSVYNNNKYLGKDKYKKYTANGTEMNFVGESFEIPEPTTVSQILGNKEIVFTESGNNDVVDKYRINEGDPESEDGMIKIEVSEEAPKDYEKLLNENGIPITIDSREYVSSGIFYDYLSYSFKEKRYKPIGETDGVDYYFISKDSGVIPIDEVTMYEANAYYNKSTGKYIQNNNGFVPYLRDVYVILQMATSDYDGGMISTAEMFPVISNNDRKMSYTWDRFMNISQDSGEINDFGEYTLNDHPTKIEFDKGKEPSFHPVSIELMMYLMLPPDLSVFEHPEENNGLNYLYNYSFSDRFFEIMDGKNINEEIERCVDNGSAKLIEDGFENFEITTDMLKTNYVLAVSNDSTDPDVDAVTYRIYLYKDIFEEIRSK